MPTLDGTLTAAAFHGPPAGALPLLAGLDPAGPLPDRTRWLAGVCLGALGRYRTAGRYLLPGPGPGPGTGTGPTSSLALSCRASHLRQVGRHAEAEPLDEAALAAAGDPEARADALVGLVADAVGRLDLPVARARLAVAAGELPIGDSGRADIGHCAWRCSVRLAWVGAEVALLEDDPLAAAEAARAALLRSQSVAAFRHAVKSALFLGAALDAAGRPRPAARLLRAAAADADRLGLPPLVWPARTLRARILADRAPHTAARERQQARSAQSLIEDPAGGRTTR